MYSTVQYSAVQYSTVQPELKRGADASGHVTLLRPFLCGDPAPRTALACRGGWGLEAVDVDVIRWTCTLGCWMYLWDISSCCVVVVSCHLYY